MGKVEAGCILILGNYRVLVEEGIYPFLLLQHIHIENEWTHTSPTLTLTDVALDRIGSFFWPMA